MHMAVVNQLANKRQRYTGVQRFVQKSVAAEENHGSRREPDMARQGSTRAPQWKGGGMVFAVKPRDYDMKMNVQEKVLH